MNFWEYPNVVALNHLYPRSSPERGINPVARGIEGNKGESGVLLREKFLNPLCCSAYEEVSNMLKLREIRLPIHLALCWGGLSLIAPSQAQGVQPTPAHTVSVQSSISPPVRRPVERAQTVQFGQTQRTQTSQTQVAPSAAQPTSPAAAKPSSPRTQTTRGQTAPHQTRARKSQPVVDPVDEDVVDDDAEQATTPPVPATSKTKLEARATVQQRGSVRRIKKEVAPLLKTAYEQMVNQEFRAAVSTIRDALKEDSQCITAQRYLAFCLAEGGLPTAALDALSKLIKQIKPTYFEWCTFGEVYLRSDSLENAERCYLAAEKATPGSDFARSGLIRVYLRTYRSEEANNLCIEGMKASTDLPLYNYYVLLYTKAQEVKKVAPTAPGQEPPSDVPEIDTNAKKES